MSFDRLHEDDDDRPQRRRREDDDFEDDDRPRRRRRDSEDYAEPHRGGVVLALGIIALVMQCFIFGIVAWVLGAADLRAMEEGRMDPEGKQLTQVGKILGIVSCVLTAFIILLYGVIIAIAVVAGVAAK